MNFAVDSTIQKLTLLFVLDKMEIPLTENSLIDICTSRNNWLTYMDFKEIMPDLVNVGFVYKENVGNDIKIDEIRFAITYEGRDCLSNFYLRIPQSLREQITTFAKANQMTFKKSQEYLSEYIKNPDGSYKVVLKIKEPLNSTSLLEINLKASNKASAISTCNKWGEKAPNTFEFLYDNLLDY